MAQSISRTERWHVLASELKPVLMGQVHKHLVDDPAIDIPEAEFALAFEKIEQFFAENAETVRPDVWVAMLYGFTNRIERLKLKGAKWPEPSEI